MNRMTINRCVINDRDTRSRKPGKSITCSLLFVALVGFTQIASAQQESVQPDFTDRAVFEHFTVENSLPENSALTIIQDKYGYIWIGTQSGIVRYDGVDFKQYLSRLDTTVAMTQVINKIAEDSEGNIWMTDAFGGGLAMFDQRTQTFSHYRVAADSAVEHVANTLYDLHIDDRDNVWFTGENPGNRATTTIDSPSISRLYRMDAESREIQSYTVDPSDLTALFGLTSYRFDSIYSGMGDTWVSTVRGLLHWAAGSVTFDRLDFEPDSNRIKVYSSFLERGDGSLWLVRTSGDREPSLPDSSSVCRVATNREKLLCYDLPSPGKVAIASELVETKDGRFLALTSGGYCEFEDVQDRFVCEHSWPDEWIIEDTPFIPYDAQMDDAGRFWLLDRLTSHPLSIFDPTTGAVHEVAVRQGVDDTGPAEDLRTILLDRQGVLWAGNFYIGLNKLDTRRSRFELIDNTSNSNPKLPSNRIRKLANARDGAVWITHATGLSKLDPVSRQISSIDSGYHAAVLEDASGRVWVSIANGMARVDLESGITTKYLHDANDETTVSGQVGDFLQDRAGRIWVFARGYDSGINQFFPETGLFRRYPVMKRPRFGASDSLSQGEGHGFVEARDGSIWIATDEGGVSRFDPDSARFMNFYDRTGIVGTIDIIEAEDGAIWVASGSSGIQRLDPTTGRGPVFTETDGLIHNTARKIVADRDGILWISSTRGLSRLDPVTHKIRGFGKEAGVPVGNLYDGVLASDGSILFGSGDGIVRFYPDDLQPDEVVPEVVIESVSFFSGDDSTAMILDRESITLSSTENDLTFKYAGFQFKQPSGNQYRYRLDGYDSEWTDAGTSREARYTNLGAGDYVFEVLASNADGAWTPEPARLVVTILPPWWKTIWAYFAYACLLGFVGFRFDRFQRARIAERERQKQHEALTSAHEELETSHQILKSTQAQLIESEKLASLGALTAGIAHEIKNPLNFVNNFAEVSAEMMDELADAVASGDAEEATALLADLRGNAEQIAKHGKRADSIVKSMMQHARGDTSEAESVEINTYLEEYIGLAWHGMRARDDDFQAEVIRDFAIDAGSLFVQPQELGRVVLNLLNNAFDAVKNQSDGQVTVTSARDDKSVTITVSDNGPGIPTEIREKIFEPFFTTKATGEGTGLGLSLSHDIITKGHGGTMTLADTPGGASFIIQIPIT